MSTLGLSTLDAVAFPLIPRIPRADYTPVEMYHKVDIGTVANPEHEKRKVDLFHLKILDKELIVDVILEFQEACAPTSLSLTTAPLRFTKFHELLDDPFRSEYDDCRAAQPNMLLGFEATIRAFWERYFLPTDLLDQKNYLGQVKKLACARSTN